jgi:predicted RNase H-like nuclease (RuvC/YqgF family)
MVNIVIKFLLVILPLGLLVNNSDVIPQSTDHQSMEIVGDDHTRVLVLDLERKVNELQGQVNQLQEDNRELREEMEKLKVEVEQIRENIQPE